MCSALELLNNMHSFCPVLRLSLSVSSDSIQAALKAHHYYEQMRPTLSPRASLKDKSVHMHASRFSRLTGYEDKSLRASWVVVHMFSPL